MISTLTQYFLATFCLFFLASSLVNAGEHAETAPEEKVREIATVTKEDDGGESVAVPNEDGTKLIESYEKLQSKLKQFKTGNISVDSQ